ncbi:type II restriction-modification system restriction subunit [Phocaeicola coprophilus CAG:333]|uniref:McrB family protein n=1 Tax=Phocaeicola coprophilus TaxID=387090 RepID=UPI000336AAB2|nr:AAA family ATPase [Phocaeicola coprophilus]CDC56695.1 type II restriction-modification system restriction subunit [Phocaeicola coprophilus CAG:333]
MKIDFGSLAFNINVNGKIGGTPSWGTAIVYQTTDNKIKEDIAKDILIGMIYKKIDCTSNELSLPLGKGGHIYHGDEDFNTNGAPSIPYLAAKFEKTYVNGISIGKPFILVVMKDGYEAHDGRLQLKYSPKISWGSYTNQEFFDEAFKILGINSGSPFVCYEIEVYDQDTLHFRCAYKEEEYQFKDKNEYYEFVNNAISNDQSIKPFVIHDSIIKFPIQTIFYGAPGTGKSNKIEECTNNDNRIRTTFHPDSDYSTFVGAYKPTMEETGVTVAGRKETRIAYKYVPQAFLKAYVNAWEKMNEGNDSPYYLVIEEINRGNCAQIFGDLFQLLDRGDDGQSKYAICPDDDIRRHLAEQFKNATNIPDAIKNGEEMRLPSNLYIWATMNTSDQSLFPIDSAFKRRWDWEYMPIEKGDKDFVIEIGSKQYDWWNFISIINNKIDDITGSEDKKLGYWFAKPADNSTTIKCNQFVSKVLFYLWNDVYKDYSDDNRSIFRITDGNNSKKIAFTEFFGTGREEKIYSFMQANGINPISSNSENNQDENFADDEAGIPTSQRDYSKYSINGYGAYGKGELVRRVIDLYCKQSANSSASDIRTFWMGLNTGIVHLVETQSEFDSRTINSTDANKRAKELKLSNGESIYVSTQVGSGNIQTFINAVNSANINLSIAKV